MARKQKNYRMDEEALTYLEELLQSQNEHCVAEGLPKWTETDMIHYLIYNKYAEVRKKQNKA